MTSLGRERNNEHMEESGELTGVELWTQPGILPSRDESRIHTRQQLRLKSRSLSARAQALSFYRPAPRGQPASAVVKPAGLLSTQQIPESSGNSVDPRLQRESEAFSDKYSRTGGLGRPSVRGNLQHSTAHVSHDNVRKLLGRAIQRTHHSGMESSNVVVRGRGFEFTNAKDMGNLGNRGG